MDGGLYPINKIKDQSHSDTKLFKIKLSIAINVRQIPNFLELLIAKPTIPEDAGSLRVVQPGLAIGE